MGIVAGFSLALGSLVVQAGRPTLGPTAALWVWVAPGLVEVVASGADERDLFLCGLSTDLRPRTVEVRALDPGGKEIGRSSWRLLPARPAELPLEPLFAAGAAAHPQAFTLIIGGLEISPGWLAVSLRAQSATCGVDHPPGTWVQADPSVASQLMGGARAGGS